MDGEFYLSTLWIFLGKIRRAARSNFQSNFFLDRTIALSPLRRTSTSADSTLFLFVHTNFVPGRKEAEEQGEREFHFWKKLSGRILICPRKVYDNGAVKNRIKISTFKFEKDSEGFIINTSFPLTIIMIRQSRQIERYYENYKSYESQ